MNERERQDAKGSPHLDGKNDRKPLTVEALEARIAPAMVGDKKAPNPPPYGPGTLYGLVRRSNLAR